MPSGIKARLLERIPHKTYPGTFGPSDMSISQMLFPFIVIGVILIIPLVILIILVISLFSRLKKGLYRLAGKELPNVQLEELPEEWELLVKNKNVDLFMCWKGERPEYILLRSEPAIDGLEDKFFGYWFHPMETGVLLRQLTSLETADTHLVYLDTVNLELITLEKNIPSVPWTINQSSENQLELWCNTGEETLRFHIGID